MNEKLTPDEHNILLKLLNRLMQSTDDPIIYRTAKSLFNLVAKLVHS